MKTKSKTHGHVIRSVTIAVLLSCAIVAFTSAFNPPSRWSALPAKVVRPATQTKTLTIADRIAYQRAIEEVYWRHRVWPKENSKPKPSLDKVMSQAQIEKKVEDYLRNSQLLEQYWQKPITPEQLQTEMDRMARHTKQPDVLREIFAALGNDPGLVAECVARPALAERLIENLYAHDSRFHGQLKQRAEAELAAHHALDQMKKMTAKYTEVDWVKTDRAKEASVDGKQDNGAVRMNESEWKESVEKLAEAFGSTNSEVIPTDKLSDLREDDASYYAAAVIRKGKDRLKLTTVAWMKQPFDSWRAKEEKQIPVTMAAAITAKYRLPNIGGPSVDCIDDWAATSTTNAPEARYYHTAVWTGSEMIVWGGFNEGSVLLNTGGRYSPSTDSWTATSTTNAPIGRAYHTAVWTGTKMIVWGGISPNGELNPGGRYDAATDSWAAVSITNAPEPRFDHTAVWSGIEMIVWGGSNGNIINNLLNTGGRYDPVTNSWTATSTTNAPEARATHTAVWTGSEMIVWGGLNLFQDVDTGGRYDPSTDSWTATSTTNAPAARENHTAVWTGSEMIVWGGQQENSTIFFNTGGKYDPSTDSWTATSTANAADARAGHTGVWDGSEMIVWGGYTLGPVLNTGGRYTPNTNSWTETNTTDAPEARAFHTAVWTSSEMIVWGASVNGNPGNTGGRYCAQSGSTPTPTPTPSPSPSPTPTPTPSDKALNLSTRVDVETGTNVGIGGFIINGTDSKLIVTRAIGPSLIDFGVAGALADPVLELHDSNGDVIATNDDWMDNSDADQQLLIDAFLNPTNDLESAIIKSLDPGLYTAVVSGGNGGTGVALIELYDLDDPGATGELANISTRGFVGTEANVMIGGVIVGPEGGLDAAVVVRAIGPSLADFGVADPLLDPVLELRNGDGDLVAMNDNWETDPPPNNYSAAVTAAGLAPSDASESAIFANLTNGLYTAIVSGKDGTTGAGLVEVYHVAAQ
jgi:N-acetylneuraminic acid mutarotase